MECDRMVWFFGVMMGWEGARWFGRVLVGGIRRTGDGAGRDGKVLVGYIIVMGWEGA